MKIAKCLNIIEIDKKIYQMNKLDTLKYLNKQIEQQHPNYTTTDIKFVTTDSKNNVFKLLIVFK